MSFTLFLYLVDVLNSIDVFLGLSLLSMLVIFIMYSLDITNLTEEEVKKFVAKYSYLPIICCILIVVIDGSYKGRERNYTY